MLIPILALTLLPAPAVQLSPAVEPVEACHRAGGHGKLSWFEGSFEQALASAAATERIVFLDFWTEW